MTSSCRRWKAEIPRTSDGERTPPQKVQIEPKGTEKSVRCRQKKNNDAGAKKR